MPDDFLSVHKALGAFLNALFRFPHLIIPDIQSLYCQ